jgi:hypothetical protein
MRGLDSTGSGQGPVAGSCECGDEPSGSGATELYIYIYIYIYKAQSIEFRGSNSTIQSRHCNFSSAVYKTKG